MAPGKHQGVMPKNFDNFWLAETLRLRESLWGPLEDASELRKLQSAPGTFEARVLARARMLAEREGMAQTLAQWRSVARLTLLLFAGAAFLLGCGAAAGALGPGGSVNLAPAVTALLGLNTLAFLLWLASFLMQGSAAGSVLASAWLKLTRKLARGPDAVLLPRALLELLSRQRLQRWAAGTLSHGLWVLALAGALLTLVALLVTRRYTFHWETTLLSPDTFVTLVQGLGRLPSLLGFPEPPAAIIRSSSGPSTLPDAAHAAWSIWLIGMVVTYGLLPRLAALAVSITILKRRQSTLTLDTTLPGIVELRERLMPASESTGIDRPAPSLTTSGLPPVAARPGVGTRRALVGVELPAELAWQGPELPPGVNDLGIVDSRPERRRLLATLHGDAVEQLLVCCDARQTPDRGTVAFLVELAGLAQQPRLLLLPDDASATRREQWLQQLMNAGFEVEHFFRTRAEALHWLAGNPGQGGSADDGDAGQQAGQAFSGGKGGGHDA